MLKMRLLVSAPLVTLGLLAFLWPGVPGGVIFFGLAAFFMVTGVFEFFAMTARTGQRGYPRLTAGFGLLLLTAAMLGGRWPTGSAGGGALDILVMITFVMLGFLCVFRKPLAPDSLAPLFLSLGGFFYVCWTLSFIAKLYFSAELGPVGRHLVVFIVAVVKLSDVGAFAIGTWTARRPKGNHKLAPALSPKKSWEGLAGGVAAGVLSALALRLLWVDAFVVDGVPVFGAAGALAFGVALPLLGLLGDLAESALKRAADVKNSGRLPGLGGSLDILDSLMLTAPVFYAVIHLALTR